MALTKRSESNTVFLEVKHYSLWRELKKQEDGCESVEVTNPKSGVKSTKFGYKFHSVSGRAVKLSKYDTGTQYPTRYFGFNLHLVDNGETFVVKMPYNSQVLRRFLRIARNIDFTKPISLTVFKGKGKDGKAGAEETGIWFQQDGETIKAYYSREQPHGMPEATQDPIEQTWDFKPQHRWLVERLQSETIPDIERAAAKAPIEPYSEDPDEEGPPNDSHADDDDLPF